MNSNTCPKCGSLAPLGGQRIAWEAYHERHYNHPETDEFSPRAAEGRCGMSKLDKLTDRLRLINERYGLRVSILALIISIIALVKS